MAALSDADVGSGSVCVNDRVLLLLCILGPSAAANIRIIVSDPDTHHHALHSGVKRTRWRASLGGILIGFIGVLIVLQPTSSSINAGHVACLGAVVAAAVNSLITRKVGQREKTSVMLIYPLVGNFLIMGLILPFVYVPMPLNHLAAVTLISLLGFLAMFCIIIALKKASAGVVAPM